MRTHVLYVETPDDVTGQDVVLAIQCAFDYAVDDYRECIEAGVDEEDLECYKGKIDLLESIHILEDEPDHMVEVTKKEYADFVRKWEDNGAETIPVSTESNHPTAPKVSAMQTSISGRTLIAQAEYWGSNPKPKYKIRRDMI